jgi:hypothetical protein
VLNADTTLKGNPALVKAVDHADTGHGKFHSLRPEGVRTDEASLSNVHFN